MKIEITMGNTIQISATADNGQYFTPEIDEALLDMIYELSDYIKNSKPKDSIDIALEHIINTANEETLLTMKGLFPKWSVGTSLKAGEVIEFNTELYKVIQEHRTQLDWLPPDVPALYKLVQPPNTIGAWRQPQGAHDAYQKGDKVLFEGNTYESLIDANTWSPTAYPDGWDIRPDLS